MKKRWTLLLGTLVIGCFAGLPREAQAFDCTSFGKSIGGEGTYTVPVDVVIDKTSTYIQLVDLGPNTTCYGNYGSHYKDALRVVGATVSPVLQGLGFSGILTNNGQRIPFPASGNCIWPDSNCYYVSNQNVVGLTRRVNVTLGIERTEFNDMSGVTIPVGSEIARLQVEQRGLFAIGGSVINTWSANKTWIFTLKKALVIPSYSCVISNPGQEVELTSVKKKDLQDNGIGAYPDPTAFQLNLLCDKDTTVSVQFDGTTMSGKNDVLANSVSKNNSVGIQLVDKRLNQVVQFGQKVKVIDNANAVEELRYEARYYYDGGSDIQAGGVRATATFTLTYQ
ncbi:fimbrial protein [Klebsiella oxytoca]|uniref:fimbrial protein n=1 Tax=Klebsiella oxytoca TaxID=571 RepID=UPI00157AA694|nr:fimbrial protein [Klebsiella oxytoca]